MLKTRVDQHRSTFDSFELIQVYATFANRKAERSLLKECKRLGVRRTIDVAGRRQRELVQLTEAFTLCHLLDLASQIIQDTEHPVIQAYRNEIESMQLEKNYIGAKRTFGLQQPCRTVLPPRLHRYLGPQHLATGNTFPRRLV